MGWADSFFSAYNSEVGRRRQSRLDALQADMQRSELALRQAASSREETRLRMQDQENTERRDRQGYLDRRAQLGRETAPFAKLLGAFPGADASAYTGAAYDLDERIARDPSLAGRPVADPATEAAQAAGYEPMGPAAPTHGEARASAIDEAYRRFGGAQKAREEAIAELRRQLGSMRATAAKPYSKDLEQEQRALDRMQSDIAKMEQGLILGPDGQWQNIALIRDPAIKERHAASLKQLKSQWGVRRRALDQAYQQRLGVSGAVGFDPGEFFRAQAAQGVPEEQIIEELTSMGYEVGE